MIKSILCILLSIYMIIQFVIICICLNITDNKNPKHMKRKVWFRKPKHMLESE